MELRVTRLVKANPEHWKLYPVWERRVLDFCTRHLLTETDQDKLALELQTRWLFKPEESGFFLLQDQTDQPVGHVASWVAEQWGKKYGFVYQFEMASWFHREAIKPCFEQFFAWLRGLGLDTFNLETPHESKLFIRYLRMFGIESFKTRSVIRARIDTDGRQLRP